MNDRRTFVGDFETTVYDGQTYTEVWASACVEIGTEDVLIFNSIDEQFKYLCDLNCDVTMYYHNLKFDGNFWLSFLLTKLKYNQALVRNGNNIMWVEDKEMYNNSFKYCISDMGQWYSITIKVNNHTILLLDSLKLLPFSVKKIGKDFKTKHKKLEMEYTGYRYAGCTITPQEKEYIANDVLVVKEALEFMFNEGHNKMTIGSCCLSEYRKLTGEEDYKSMFPQLTEIGLDDEYGCSNVDKYIRRSYKGGWCYLVKDKANKVYKRGVTADVNSLYPSMMSSESGNAYPIGEPTFWKGNYIPQEALDPNKYYFVRIKTRFYLKKDMLPFVQIKGSFLYPPNECLETSDVYDKTTNKYHPFYIDPNGVTQPAIVTLTLTMTDFELLQDHYNLEDFEILDGCYFWSRVGIFDNYIEKYKKIKMTSKGAMRQLAKLFLNNLYGKMSSSTDSSFKVAYVKDDESIGFTSYNENNKKAGYIAVGSAITSYARNFTIRTAQANYHGVDKGGFIYADTDSIHCDLSPDELVNLKTDDNAFCCWKLESTWDTAIFVRQKTYIEHVIEEDLKPIDTPYYNVKCAGMPDRCKNLFVKSLEHYEIKKEDKFNEEEKEIINKHYTLADFKLGLTLVGKLLPKRIKGGILLVDTTYKMR